MAGTTFQREFNQASSRSSFGANLRDIGGPAFVTDPRFGALGDGSTDDLTAIQAAIDYQYGLGGGVVYFPPCASGYRVSNTIVKPEGVWLVGGGAEFENNGAVFRGSVIVLMTVNSVAAGAGIVECSYRGTYGVAYTDKRDLGGIHNMMIWGNKDNVSNGNCVTVLGLRYCTLDNVYLLYAAEKGLLTSTATVGPAELALRNVYALYNAGTGFDITATDCSQVSVMAGSNGRVATGTGNGPGDGVTLRSVNRFQGKFHCWDNGREGVSISAGSDNQLDILAQDNDRFGVLVSASVSFSNDIRCTVTGNGKSTVNSYADSSRVGVQVSAHGACRLNVTASASTTGTSSTASQKSAIRNLSDQCSVVGLDSYQPTNDTWELTSPAKVAPCRQTERRSTADDVAFNFTPSCIKFRMRIVASGIANTESYIEVLLDGTTPTLTAIGTLGTAVVLDNTTGTLASAGGTDGKLNVRVNATKVYVSNRLGSTAVIVCEVVP